MKLSVIVSQFEIAAGDRRAPTENAFLSGSQSKDLDLNLEQKYSRTPQMVRIISWTVDEP